MDELPAESDMVLLCDICNANRCGRQFEMLNPRRRGLPIARSTSRDLRMLAITKTNILSGVLHNDSTQTSIALPRNSRDLLRSR